MNRVGGGGTQWAFWGAKWDSHPCGCESAAGEIIPSNTRHQCQPHNRLHHVLCVFVCVCVYSIISSAGGGRSCGLKPTWNFLNKSLICTVLEGVSSMSLSSVYVHSHIIQPVAPIQSRVGLKCVYSITQYDFNVMLQCFTKFGAMTTERFAPFQWPLCYSCREVWLTVGVPVSLWALSQKIKQQRYYRCPYMDEWARHIAFILIQLHKINYLDSTGWQLWWIYMGVGTIPECGSWCLKIEVGPDAKTYTNAIQYCTDIIRINAESATFRSWNILKDNFMTSFHVSINSK